MQNMDQTSPLFKAEGACLSAPAIAFVTVWGAKRASQRGPMRNYMTIDAE